jgi:hypothetical protein
MAAGRGGRRRRRVASRVLGCGGDGEEKRRLEQRNRLEMGIYAVGVKLIRVLPLEGFFLEMLDLGHL